MKRFHYYARGAVANGKTVVSKVLSYDIVAEAAQARQP